MYLGRCLVALVVFLAAVFSFVTPASAQPDQAPVTVDDSSPTAVEKDGKYETSVGFNNLTKEKLTLRLAAKQEAGCGVKPSITELQRSVSESVKVTLGSGCEKLAFDVTVHDAGGKAALDTIAIDPEQGKEEATADLDWGKLKYSYLVALVLTLVGTTIIYFLWTSKRKGQELPENNPELRWNLKTPLLYLGAGWTLSGSWLTNISTLGAAFAAIFGAQIAPSFLDGDAKSDIQLIAIAGLVTALLVAVGTTVVLATQSKYTDSVGNLKTGPSVFGVLLGAALAASGTLGLIFSMVSVVEAREDLDLFRWIEIPLILAAFVAAVYCWRSLREVLRLGVTKQVKDPQAVGLDSAEPEPEPWDVNAII